MGFECEPAVSWHRLIRELSRYHMRIISSELAEEHIKFLSIVIGADSQERSISWQKFNKELLPERTFTFWEWFHGTCETSRRHMLPLWQDGLVHGYVSKDDAQEMLIRATVGNFMMRFSASIVGGVSISWCTVTDTVGAGAVDYLLCSGRMTAAQNCQRSRAAHCCLVPPMNS